jgi:hypothetical protein
MCYSIQQNHSSFAACYGKTVCKQSTQCTATYVAVAVRSISFNEHLSCMSLVKLDLSAATCYAVGSVHLIARYTVSR